MNAFWAAVQFLTRLPTPALAHYDEALAGRSALYFPLVGLLMGALLWLLAVLAAGAAPGVQAALVLALWVGLSGGLHLDGLGDSADAWLGGHGDRRRTLEIMKDPRAGAAAVIAIALLLIVKFAALEALLANGHAAWLLLVPLLGRASSLALFLTTPSARSDGFGAILGQHLPRRAAGWVILSAALLPLAMLGLEGLWLLLALLALGLGLRHLMLQRLGGCSGDTAGALTEFSEAAALLVLGLI
ncbi:MAG TPA: adenosylcobinamide-GDP ribazoletransferase [Gammaproteobacteria bacterium]|nr:adenosylcobinamide-GDP ribazoletransferase [Gammaproteobacteria bacterium]